MKKFTLLFASALAFFAIAACSDDEDKVVEETYDEAYYASQATVTSSDANFTANSNGGTISFNTEGGSVVLAVSCGCDWTIENDAADLFPASVSGSTVTITADQNTVEEELTGSITFKTLNDKIVFATVTATQSAYGAPTISVETNEVNLPAVGDLTVEIGVEATAEWSATAEDVWLTVSNNGGTSVVLTASENEGSEERITKVTLTCSDGISSTTDYITVTQDAHAYITLSVTELSFEATASSENVTVESNCEWTAVCNDEWVTVTVSENTVTVAVAANEDIDDRLAYVVFTAGDGENVAETQLKVEQIGAVSDALILTYSVTSDNLQVALPLAGTENCTVNWGDETSTETVTDNYPTHTYGTAGEYRVEIEGTVTQLRSDTSTNGSGIITGAECLIKVISWGNTGLTSMQSAFRGCSNLVSVTGKTEEAFANVTTFANAFYGCTALEEIPAGLFKGCAKVTTFQSCFYECTSLKTVPNYLFQDCSSCTTFNNIFSYCANLETIYGGLFYGCTSAYNIQALFAYCSSLKEIPEGLLDNFLPSSTTAPTGVFQNCTSLTKVPVSLFDKLTNIAQCASLFQNCSSVEGESPYTIVNGEKVHLYERSTANGFDRAVSVCSNCFTGSSFSDIDSIPSKWGGNGE